MTSQPPLFPPAHIDAAAQVAPAIAQALEAADLDAIDAGLGALAYRLALDLDAIDPAATADSTRVARVLVDVLERAGMTPAARGAAGPAYDTDPVAEAQTVSLEVVAS